MYEALHKLTRGLKRAQEGLGVPLAALFIGISQVISAEAERDVDALRQRQRLTKVFYRTLKR